MDAPEDDANDPDEVPPPDVPPHWRPAADEVVAHLAALRGSGAFLSSADGWQLVRWLEAGVAVDAILCALERAALTRRKKRARTPLSLVAANRHLGKPAAGAFRKGRPAGSPSARLAPALPADLPPSAAKAQLEAALLGVEGTDRGQALRTALEAVRSFLDAAWAALGDDGRSALRDEARAELGDLLVLVDETVGVALVEETARDHLRQRYPTLSAASLAELLA